MTSTYSPPKVSVNISTMEPTKTPTNTPTQSPTKTSTNTPTVKPMMTPTKTSTKTPTNTPTNTPTMTPTQSPMKTSSNISTMEPMMTPTKTSTITPMKTPTKTPVSQEVVKYMSDLYVRLDFWNQLIQKSKNTELLESLKEQMICPELDIEEVVKNKDKRNLVVKCDSDLKHLLTKLKFIDELYDGFILKTRNRINSYQMKDFQHN